MYKLNLLLFITALVAFQAQAIPAVVWGPGAFVFSATGNPIIVLDDGTLSYFQNTDGDFVVRKNEEVKFSSGVVQATGCVGDQCRIEFQNDGNLVSTLNGVPTWSTGTGGGVGKWLVFYNIAPYVVIYDAAFNPVWVAPVTEPASPPPKMTDGYNPCEDGSASQCGRFADPGPGFEPPVPDVWYEYTVAF